MKILTLAVACTLASPAACGFAQANAFALDNEAAGSENATADSLATGMEPTNWLSAGDDRAPTADLGASGAIMPSYVPASGYWDRVEIKPADQYGGVSEPVTWAMTLLGLAGLGLSGYRRKTSAHAA